jgi:toxin-antitoxin system, antitoxin component, xre family
MIFQDHIGMSNNAFATKCGINPSNYSKMLKGQQTFTTRSLVKIGDAFPILNTEWLITGEGEMLVDVDDTVNVSLAQEDTATRRCIPVYDAETTGGFNGYVSSSMEDSKQIGEIDPGAWFDYRETAAIRHNGDSMVEYPNGCYLAVREVKEFRLLVPGRNYVIETEEYRVTKRIQKGSSPNTLALYSSNQEKYEDGRLIHEPFEVDIEDIRRIYSILGYVMNLNSDAQFVRTR